MPIHGLLALVQQDLPRSPSGLRVLRNSDSELAGQLDRLLQLCAKIAPLNYEGRKSAFAQSLLGAASIENLYDHFSRHIQAVRDMQASITMRYMPDELVRQVHPLKQPADPAELLFTGFSERLGTANTGDDARRRVFEARRDLILALLDWDLRWTKRIGKDYTDEDRSVFLNALETQGILCEVAGKFAVHSLHDPRDSMRSVWVDQFNGKEPGDPEGRLIRKLTHLTLGKIRLPSGRIIAVGIEFRRKGLLSIVAKMLAVEGEGVQAVEDRRGMRFLYASVEDLQEGAAFIRGHLPLVDFMTGKERYRDTTDVQAPLLPAVARNFPAISFFRTLAGHRVQLQNFVAMHHLDLIFVRSPDNHEIYKLRKHARGMGLFFWLFPPAIYSIRWNAGAVFPLLYSHVLASLSSS